MKSPTQTTDHSKSPSHRRKWMLLVALLVLGFVCLGVLALPVFGIGWFAHEWAGMEQAEGESMGDASAFNSSVSILNDFARSKFADFLQQCPDPTLEQFENFIRPYVVRHWNPVIAKNEVWGKGAFPSAPGQICYSASSVILSSRKIFTVKIRMALKGYKPLAENEINEINPGMYRLLGTTIVFDTNYNANQPIENFVPQIFARIQAYQKNLPSQNHYRIEIKNSYDLPIVEIRIGPVIASDDSLREMAPMTVEEPPGWCRNVLSTVTKNEYSIIWAPTSGNVSIPSSITQNGFTLVTSSNQPLPQDTDYLVSFNTGEKCRGKIQIITDS